MTIIELCEKLRNKRTELGLNIEEVVEKTKLYPSAIKDIEAGNLDNIASAYLKGYIRIYSSFLNVNLEDALEDLNTGSTLKNRSAINRQESLKEKSKQEARPENKKEQKPLPPHIKKIILYVIIILIVFPFLLAFGRFISKRISQAPKKSVVKTIKPITKTPVPVTQNKSKAVTALLGVKKDCYVRVRVDGKVLFEGVLKKGVSETWKGRKEIEFKISDGSSVYLEVNGKPLPSLTSSHKPIKSLKITSSGVAVSK
ncbi:MAG: RodZ domain-containing protein [Candidatus Omnitrophota bacterium]|jgi:transcriptional regulator with XRE-family HTH domain